MTKSFFKPFLNIIEQALKTGKKQLPASYGDMIIINPQGQFLILERANSDDFENNQWCLPGGHIEVGESPVVAAHREAQEETNLEIDFDTISFLREKSLEDGGKIYYYSSSIDELGDKVVLDTTEHQNYAWILPEEIVNYDFIFDLSDILCDVFDVKKVELDSDLLNTNDYLDNAVIVLNKALDTGQIEDDTYVRRLNQIESIRERYSKEVVQGFRTKQTLIKAEDNIALEMKKQYKDYIANGYLYNGKLYDSTGMGIAATSDEVKQYSQNGTIFNADAYEEVDPKTNLEALDPKRAAFLRVLPTIKRYDEHFLHYENQLANQYNSSQNNFKQRRSELQQTVEATPDILAALNIIKDELQDHIDPLFTVKFNEGRSKVAFMSELEKYLTANPDNSVASISIRDLADYDEGEFKIDQFKFGSIDNINAVHQKVVDKMQRRKRVEEKLSKALDLGLISDEMFLDANNLLKGEDSEKFESDLDSITLPNDKGEDQDYSEEQLREHAKNTSLANLEGIIKNSDNPVLRELAHQEIKRREVEEHIQDDKKIEKSVVIESLEDLPVEILKGCVMYYPQINKEKWNAELRKLIPEDITIEYESDPHVTILYGLEHEKINVDEIRSAIQEITDHQLINFNLQPISVFENDKDVVKIGINDFRVLTQLNTLLRERFPYQSNFPDYNPHITLAYVNKGEGERFKGISINPENWGLENNTDGIIVYSSPEKEKTLITETGGIIIPERRTA